MSPETIWHYTIAATLLEIVESGEIRTAIAGLPPGVKPVVWFSTNPFWEETATKMIGGSEGFHRFRDIEEMYEYSKTSPIWTPARVAVDASVAPHRWKDYKDRSGAKGWFTKALYDAAIGQGAKPAEWRWTAEKVPASSWTAIEIYRDGAWVPCSKEELEPHRDTNPALDPGFGDMSEEQLPE